MRKTLCILSGGMDSAVLLSELVREVKEARHPLQTHVAAVTFNYGSKHNHMEGEMARNLAHFYEIKHSTVNLPLSGFDSSLIKQDEPVPHGHYEDETMKRTVVPFRNSIMLMYAAGMAESMGFNTVGFGAHAGDHAIYPDCRVDYMNAVRYVFALGGYRRIELHAPFAKLTKRAIGRVGKLNDVPFHLTYSCYEGQLLHCGKCGTCVERKEALEGFDPTEYRG